MALVPGWDPGLQWMGKRIEQQYSCVPLSLLTMDMTGPAALTPHHGELWDRTNPFSFNLTLSGCLITTGKENQTVTTYLGTLALPSCHKTKHPLVALPHREDCLDMT